MRVISQDGTIDIPYDETVFTVNDTCIHAYHPATQTLLMARYSSDEKANRVMEMMREAYVDCNTCTQKRSTDGSVSISAYVRNAVLQFPEDDEVET